MAKGISLHVGVKGSPAFPSAPILNGCENDAKEMHRIARCQNFTGPEPILGGNAKYKRIVTEIENAAAELVKGDIFLFTFAGHGSGEPDSEPDEPDSQDETLVLFDHMLYDDVLGRCLWPKFKCGVRVLMVADSCHSGSVSTLRSTGGLQAREISEDTRRQHVAAHRDCYKKMLSNLPAAAAADPIQASVLLLAACRDDEEAGDGPHGVFTEALIHVWDGGDFSTYRDFMTAIKSAVTSARPQQHPVLSPPLGSGPEFSGQHPFAI